MIRRASALLWLSALLIAAGPAVRAADCQLGDPSDNPFGAQILALRASGCFSTARDESPLAKGVKELIARADSAEGPERSDALIEALLKLGAKVDSERASAEEPWPANYQLVADRLAVEVMNIPQPGSGQTYWEPEGHRFFQIADGDWLLDYGPILDGACADPSAPRCRAAADEALELNRLAGLIHEVLAAEAQSRNRPFAAAVGNLKKQWDYYFDEARSQYWWELAINSSRYSARDTELAMPPPDQLIVLHPMVALEYVGGGAENETSYDTVALAEIIGYNRLRWHAADKEMAKTPIGLSLVATYTPDNTGDHVGWGLLLHFKNTWTVGATRRDTGAGDDTTWIVSADLLKGVLKKTNEARGWFRCRGTC